MTERRDSRGCFIKSNVLNKSRHPVCRQCGCKLIRLKWNDKCDVLVCNTWNCPKYRQLAGTVKIETMKEWPYFHG